MDKQELLSELKNSLEQGALHVADVQAVLGEYHREHSEEKSSAVTAVLYYSGAAIVLIGLIVFFVQNWDVFSSAMRIFVTLGFGIALLVSGIMLKIGERLHHIPTAMQSIAGILIPIGAFVTLYELGFREGNWGSAIVFLVLCVSYAVLARVTKGALFAFFSILYGSIATLLASNALVGGSPIFDETRFTMYQFFAIGLSYLLIAFGAKERPLIALKGWLYGVGTFAVLLSGMVLGGWFPDHSAVWELLYLPIVFLFMYSALAVRSRVMLVLASIALVGFIFKITGEYFSDWLSWPLLLILSGIVVMGVGYLTYYLNKKYLSVKAPQDQVA